MKFLLFILVTLVFFLNISTDDAMANQIEYCNLVELYESQSGVEHHKRDGHPNYNEVNCERIKNKSRVD